VALTTHTGPRESQNINELLSRVTHGFDSPHRPYIVKNHQRTAVTCDAWIRHPTEPTRDSEMTNELLSRVTLGLYSPHRSMES